MESRESKENKDFVGIQGDGLKLQLVKVMVCYYRSSKTNRGKFKLGHWPWMAEFQSLKVQ